MKILVIADNHYCEKSSVINGRKGKYSDRIQNQIETFKWVESFGLPVIHLGDFFDKSILKAEEVQAFEEEIKPHLRPDSTYLLGNHEYNGDFDLLNPLGTMLIRSPLETTLDAKLKVLFLPFNSTEEDIKGDYDIIFGHIGLKDIPFGAKGFDFEVINKHCKMFLNGHLHNRFYLGENKWNIGSLTAQNFSDDCIDYRKGAVILDTDTLTLEFVENPYAFNFFKFTWADYLNKYQKDADLATAISSPTSCISLSCKEGEKAKILESKVFEKVYYLRISEETARAAKKEEDEQAVSSIDHIGKFRKSFIDKVGESPMVLEELGEIFR